MEQFELNCIRRDLCPKTAEPSQESDCAIEGVCRVTGVCKFAYNPQEALAIHARLAEKYRQGGQDSLTNLPSLKSTAGFQQAVLTAQKFLENSFTVPDSIEDIFHDKREQPNAFCVYFLDWNGFKNINDTLGHSVGDMLIKLIGTCLRDEDDAVFRNGGDEFVITQMRFIDEESTHKDTDAYTKKRAKLCEDLSAMLNTRFHKEWNKHKSMGELSDYEQLVQQINVIPTFSLGLSFSCLNTEIQLSDDTHSDATKLLTDLIGLADAHMYEVKQQRKPQGNDQGDSN